MKHLVINKKDYNIYFQYEEDYIIAHCDVFKFSLTIMKSLIRDAYILIGIQEKVVVALHDVEDKKHFKFITAVGFTSYLGDFLVTDGTIKQIYRWKGC